MKFHPLVVLVNLALSGCGAVDSKVFSSSREYQRAIFQSEEECLAFQKDFFFNCYQTVSLFPEGSATLLLTDIMNVGTYEVSEQKITLSFVGGSEVGPRIIFTLSPDKKTLTDPRGLVFSLVEK